MPHPAGGMDLGSVEILPFDGGENIAQYVAFAASVKSMTSSLSVIEDIAVKLGQFTQKQSSARVISVPLLGAGAGGLQSEKVVAFLKRGFEANAHDGASLIVHVLHKDVFTGCAEIKKPLQERQRNQSAFSLVIHRPPTKLSNGSKT